MFSTRVISASFGLLFLLVATTSTAETTYLPPGGSTINQNHPEEDLMSIGSQTLSIAQVSLKILAMKQLDVAILQLTTTAIE